MLNVDQIPWANVRQMSCIGARCFLWQTEEAIHTVPPSGFQGQTGAARLLRVMVQRDGAVDRESTT